MACRLVPSAVSTAREPTCEQRPMAASRFRHAASIRSSGRPAEPDKNSRCNADRQHVSR